MSVAKCLGVDDINAPNMRELRAEWPQWRQMSSDLPDVDDLKDLPRWMQNAEPTQRDDVLTALRRIAEGDRRAYIVLAWLLMPGTSRIAGRIRRLADEIDEVVAGQVWVQICEHDPADDRYVAKKILDRVYRESMAELGVGDLAKRRDEAWAMTVLVDAFDESIPAGSADDGAVSKEVLTDLLQRGIDSGKLVESDRDLLLDLAHAAEQIDAPGRRGRGGLMTPSVTQLVEEVHAMSSRSIRRHAAGAIKAIREEAERGHLAM
jgi:hypothetical protein